MIIHHTESGDIEIVRSEGDRQLWEEYGRCRNSLGGVEIHASDIDDPYAMVSPVETLDIYMRKDMDLPVSIDRDHITAVPVEGNYAAQRFVRNLSKIIILDEEPIDLTQEATQQTQPV